MSDSDPPALFPPGKVLMLTVVRTVVRNGENDRQGDDIRPVGWVLGGGPEDISEDSG